MKRILFALVVTSLLGGCSMLRGHHRPTTPTVGQRIPVLGQDTNLEADPTLADVPVTVPAPAANADWPQPGGNPSKSIGHVALGASPARAWSVSIGQGDSAAGRLAAEPVVADGRVYTIDTMARVRAYSADTGAMVWEHQVRGEHSQRETLYGGGVSYDNGRVYATNGAGDIAALDAATGNQVWLVKPGGPLRGAPTIGNDNVWALSQDNQLYALSPPTAARAGRRPARSSFPACSAPPPRPSPNRPSSPATPRASSPPIATRTARSPGRTRWRAPASRPRSASSPTSTPIR
jgi:outer membrane protein assembly factor BamB